MENELILIYEIHVFELRIKNLSSGGGPEGVGHYVFSLPNGVGHAISNPRKGWVIVF